MNETLSQAEMQMLYGLQTAMRKRISHSAAEPGRYVVADGRVVDTEAAPTGGQPPPGGNAA